MNFIINCVILVFILVIICGIIKLNSYRNLIPIEPSKKNCEYNSKSELEFIVTIPSFSKLYVYPKNVEKFKPGVVLFSKYSEDPKDVFVYKPYALKESDYLINFGEISTDFVGTKDTHSDRNEILSLYIENRSLKPYYVFYRGDYLGKLEGYFPTRKNIEYSMLTNNSSKHFQLGTWIEFKMDSPNSKSQFIQIRQKFTSDIYIGDIVGRTEGNA